MPAIVHEGAVLVESTVICEYLDDTFGGPALKPPTPLGRARMRLWTKRVDEEVHPSVRPITYVTTHRHAILARGPDEVERHIASDPHPSWRERKRRWIYEGFDAPDVSEAIGTFARLLRDMNDALAESEWLVDERYTLADGALTPYANRLEMLGLSEMWAGLPHFARWFESVRERASFKAALFDYLHKDLRERMLDDGRRAWPRFREILGRTSG